MPETVLDQGSVSFRAEARLLQELGLRLVASPEVALVELIKNAYDADSPDCEVHLEDDGTALVVTDHGQGMTFDAFSSKWMRIATSGKLDGELSPLYGRRLTGAKGIGRFAVRYLGDHLTLSSVAMDTDRGHLTHLTARFDWPKLDRAGDLANVSVKYRLTLVSPTTSTGTELRITKLREDASFVEAKGLRDDVLRMVSPISGLDSDRFVGNVGLGSGTSDPGFRVQLPGDINADSLDLGRTVLDSYWARLTVNLRAASVVYTVRLASSQGKPRVLKLPVSTSISKGLFADIRFFPRRKGIFAGKMVSGRSAWTWVRENAGVAVVDHGFRIKPYGFANDDWLKLDIDTARNRRDWRSKIAESEFRIPPAIRQDPAANPALNLPYNLQLVGAVFIESKRAAHEGDEVDLVPAMDREGLLANGAADELFEFVRAGVEFLAHEDKAELNRRDETIAREKAASAREDIRNAIAHIQASTTLNVGDKTRIVAQYATLVDRLDEQEEYSAQARRSLTTMSLLGVVAGFMTHESKAAVHDLEVALSQVRELAQTHKELAKVGDDLSTRLEHLQGYLSYSRMFVRSVKSSRTQPLSAVSQVRLVLQNFRSFAEDRKIRVINELNGDVMTPPLPVTVYSGVLLNLYTNALKAVIAAGASTRDPRICFRGWTDRNEHVVEVADNGVGIPLEIRKHIWDPLYTTTSDIGNPLGSGMGLGLTLVKQVVGEYGGSIALVPDAPPGYVTCFRVRFPLKVKG